ncbi:hypothetical protein AAVH_24480 [Aphelenchoides avenae]|nr:hypothetical protein AAVH_24480 [Aphelenchus avenae]
MAQGLLRSHTERIKKVEADLKEYLVLWSNLENALTVKKDKQEEAHRRACFLSQRASSLKQSTIHKVPEQLGQRRVSHRFSSQHQEASAGREKRFRGRSSTRSHAKRPPTLRLRGRHVSH